MALLAAAASARAAWYEDLKLSADIRYRFEYIEEEGKHDRERDRIRVRLGVAGPLGDEASFGIRLTTAESKNGVGDPISGNQSLKDFESKKGVFFDLAYFDWKPAALPGLKLTAGKMSNPFIRVNDYLWDNDYTPEGLALNWSVGEDIRVIANAGYHWIQERSGDDDSMMLGGQIAFVAALGGGASLTVGGSLYTFTETKGRPVFDWQNSNNAYGNSTYAVVDGAATNPVYATDFRTAEGFAALTLDVGVPVTVFGSYAVNTEADRDDTGYSAGVKIGQLKAPGSVMGGYDYRWLEKDVTPGAFADSDSFGGGTDARGHKLHVAVQVLKNVQASVSLFLDEKKLSDPRDYTRLQVDLMAKF